MIRHRSCILDSTILRLKCKRFSPLTVHPHSDRFGHLGGKDRRRIVRSFGGYPKPTCRCTRNCLQAEKYFVPIEKMGQRHPKTDRNRGDDQVARTGRKSGVEKVLDVAPGESPGKLVEVDNVV